MVKAIYRTWTILRVNSNYLQMCLQQIKWYNTAHSFFLFHSSTHSIFGFKQNKTKQKNRILTNTPHTNVNLFEFQSINIGTMYMWNKILQNIETIQLQWLNNVNPMFCECECAAANCLPIFIGTVSFWYGCCCSLVQNNK